MDLCTKVECSTFMTSGLMPKIELLCVQLCTQCLYLVGLSDELLQ